MTRRSRTHRLLSTLTGVWFALFSVAPQASLPCPMHESAAEPASGSSASDARGSQGDHGGHATHAGMAGGVAGALADAEAPAPAHPCDCSTDCCGVPAAALPKIAVDHAPALFMARGTIAIDPTLLRAASRARLLPFANGPPALIAG